MQKRTNPFANKGKKGKPAETGKRVGKSKAGKANNQRNRILTKASGTYTIRDGRFVRGE